MKPIEVINKIEAEYDRVYEALLQCCRERECPLSDEAHDIGDAGDTIELLGCQCGEDRHGDYSQLDFIIELARITGISQKDITRTIRDMEMNSAEYWSEL